MQGSVVLWHAGLGVDPGLFGSLLIIGEGLPCLCAALVGGVAAVASPHLVSRTGMPSFAAFAGPLANDFFFALDAKMLDIEVDQLEGYAIARVRCIAVRAFIKGDASVMVSSCGIHCFRHFVVHVARLRGGNGG